MRIVKEEIFGPVVVVSRFKDEADILHKANDTMYGLAAAVFSRDISRALKTANALKAGTVWVYVPLPSSSLRRRLISFVLAATATTSSTPRFPSEATSNPVSDASSESTPSPTTLRSSRYVLSSFFIV